jgi:hypothetical protein
VGGGAIAQVPTVLLVSLRVENSLFAGNTAANSVFGAHGAAIAVSNTQASQLFYNTIVSNTLNPVSAIVVYSDTGTLSVIDNIIVGHSASIERIAGSAVENFNLFFANTANLSGTVTSGGSSFTGNPHFVSPVNYHLGVGSPAINAGTDVGVNVDFDSDTRPIGPGFDIGFDETTGVALSKHVFVPVVLR